jgi:hypothetical protein
MHSTNVRQIKAALVDQAFHGTTKVSCPLGRVVAVSRWKGQLRVMIRGWPRWYSVESVCIEAPASHCSRKDQGSPLLFSRCICQ